MKKQLDERVRIQHMISAIIEMQVFTRNVLYEDYLLDRKLQLALTRLIEIVGEAFNHVTEETKGRFTEVEWRVLTGIRTIIVHEYFGIDYTTIWAVIQQDIPLLHIKLNYVLQQLNEELD